MTALVGTKLQRDRVTSAWICIAPLSGEDLPAGCQSVLDEIGEYFSTDTRTADMQRVNLISAWEWAARTMPSHTAGRFSRLIVDFSERVLVNSEVL